MVHIEPRSWRSTSPPLHPHWLLHWPVPRSLNSGKAPSRFVSSRNTWARSLIFMQKASRMLYELFRSSKPWSTSSKPEALRLMFCPWLRTTSAVHACATRNQINLHQPTCRRPTASISPSKLMSSGSAPTRRNGRSWPSWTVLQSTR